MAQKLVLPIKECRLTASWQNQAYKEEFNFVHYGADLVSIKLKGDNERDRTVVASGRGTVIDVGKDGVAGNVIIVQYPEVFNHRTKKVITVILRYCHMATIAVLPRQKVQRGTLLGLYGATGMYDIAPHLHLEASTDIRRPYRTPTVKTSNFLRGTTDAIGGPSMLNVLDILYILKTDEQVFTAAGDPYVNEQDKKLPSMT